MTRLVPLILVVVACHPDGGRAQHPAEAQRPIAAQAGSPPAEAWHPALPSVSVEAPARQSEASDDTALAAKRWIYASFFNRLKRKVALSWDPNAVWRRVDPKGTVYGTETRHTEVRVSLSPGGQIVDITVTVPSGVKELDDEGVRAFRAAAPFGQLPEGLVQKDGRTTFSFSFYFEAAAQWMTWRLPPVT